MTKTDSSSQDRIAHTFLTRITGEVETVVQGRSMMPTIPSGTPAKVRCGAGAGSDVVAGSIVAFAAESGWIVHRVVHRGRRGAARNYLLTRGDNRSLPDGPVAIERLVGVITAVRLNGEWVPAPPPGPPPFAARVSVAFLRVLLEAFPLLAIALARGVATLRLILYIGPRRIAARLLGRAPQ